MTKSLINQKHFFSLLFFALLLAMPINSYAQTNTNISNNNGKSRISISNNGKDFKIEYEGDITLSNDDTDIVAISSGGFIEIERSSFGNRRRIVIESDRNGNLIKKYFEGRTEKNFTPEGQKWLAEVLQEIVRTTTIGAESRVNRFYNNGGANAVLTEIKRIESDYVKAAYFKLLLNKTLNNNDLVNVIDTAGNEIESDHYLASILTSNQKAFLSSNQTITAYINAAKSLESDHYITNVLKKVINDKSISDSQMDSLLEIATNINSDHYVTQVLTEVMDSRALNSQNISKIISLSKDIQSDHYKTQVLKKVINDKSLPSNAYNEFLNTLSDIKSDHYISIVINELIDNVGSSSGRYSLNKLLDVVKNSVGSDHYAATIYMKIANQNLSDDQLVSALNSLTHIQSDHSMSQALMAFANKVKNSPERVKSAYRAAAKSIGSDHYYGRAVKAID
ncbi:hypothetical protein [Pontimicrobium sp. SW4]|uniref:HEAT repeat domain-containing protein n=1 Tax=Pontimicrobium sp. SW4 TaxID=3153519 RepID=A0AAU7BWY5_9FLAO